MGDRHEPKDVRSDDKTWIVATAAVVGFLILIPCAISAGVFFYVRRFRITRVEYGAIAATGVFGLLVTGAGVAPAYITWLFALVGLGQASRAAVPWTGIVLMVCALVGAAGLVDGTTIASKLPALFRHKSLSGKPSLIPTGAEKDKIKIVAPNGITSHPEWEALLDGSAENSRPIPLGEGRFGGLVHITEEQIRTHGLVFGSTGSGKTETLKALAGGLLDLGWSGMVLDLKEDTKPGGLRDWCKEYAQYHALPYQELRLSDPDPDFWFDPLSGIDEGEARDTVLSLTRFDDEHWQSINKRMLGQIIHLLYKAHQADPVGVPAPTVYEIGRILSSPDLKAATKKYLALLVQNVEGMRPTEEFSSLTRPSPDEIKSASGFGAKIGSMYDTPAGRAVLRPTDRQGKQKRRALDVTAPGVIYIGLDSQGKPDLTRIISSAVLQRLSAYASARTTGVAVDDTAPRFLIVDEASWVDRNIVQNLLGRARSAGIAMVLATQGPKDWIDKDGNDFAKLGQNTNVAIIMSQGEPESAELCADYLGTVEYYDAGYHHVDGTVENTGTVRKERDHAVSPEELRNLRVGEAIVRVGKPDMTRRWVRITRRDPRETLVKPDVVAQDPPPKSELPGRPRPDGPLIPRHGTGRG